MAYLVLGVHFYKKRSSIEIHSMKVLCQTWGMMAFRYCPYWNPETPKRILGFNPMELDFGGCQQLVRLGLLLCFPKKTKKETNPWFCVSIPLGFLLSCQSINQSINLKKETNGTTKKIEWTELIKFLWQNLHHSYSSRFIVNLKVKG